MTAHLRTSPAVGLQWVKAEIETSLSRARGLIEQHLEAPENTQVLQQAIIELHLVNGSAGVVQCYGIVALTEEMIQGLQALVQGRIKERDAAFTALLGATVQLADYVDILAVGRDDCALALLPLINELRVSQGKGVRADADLVASEMLFLGVRPEPQALHIADGTVLSSARRLLPIFQTSLLSWLKTNDPQALLRVGKVAAQIANESSAAHSHELWRAAAAAAEAVLMRALDDNQDLRRLFGRALQQLKLLAESGEDAAAEQAGDLAYHFVFFVARSRAHSARAEAIRQDYQVARHVPPVEVVEEFRRRIRGPNTVLLNKLAREIRQDIVDVKDRIDILVRTGERGPAEFDAIASGLTRIGNTLSILGLGNEQHVVVNQVQRMRTLRNEGGADSQWMDMAVALLRVEQGLDAALFRQLRNLPEGAKRDEDDHGIPNDLRESITALVREALIELARLKTAVDGYLRTGNAAALPDASRALGQISSSLRMLEDARAADLTGQLLDAMSGPAFAELCQQPEWAGRFAEAIAYVEVYLEAVRDHRPDAVSILDDLTERIAGLRKFALPAPQAEPPPPEEAAAEEEGSLPSVDEEIRDIFLEEAAEVRALLESKLPTFRREPGERETLTEMRRAFHTLKGSGRMVGATQIGEFAWAVENMLNRCLDGSIPLGQPVVDAVSEAVSKLLPLLDAFRAGKTAPTVAGLIEKIQRLAAGKLLDVEAENELLDVFREDAAERVAEIRAWMKRQDKAAPDFEVDETTRRAFHTLRGSAAIVNLTAVSQLARDIEAYMDSVRGGGLRISSAGFALLGSAADAIEKWVADPKAAASADLAAWQARIQEVQSQIPQEAQNEAAARGLAEVFAGETLDLLQNIEATTRDWARAPENRTSPRAIKGLYQTLYGAALMAECNAIANVARAFEQLLAGRVGAARPPDAQFFDRLASLQERMYQQLDQFREGGLRDEGESLVADIEALRTGAPAAAEAVDAPEVQTTAAAPAGPSPTPVAPKPTVAPVEERKPPVEEADNELREMFVSEAEEVLQAMDREADVWERAPKELAPLRELKRAAHTLRGSSRMAGIGGIDEVSGRLEAMLESVERGTMKADSSVFARLHNATDGLYRMLDDIKRGHVPDARALIAELEADEPARMPEPTAPEVPAAAEFVAPVVVPPPAEVMPPPMEAPDVASAPEIAAEIAEPEPEPESLPEPEPESVPAPVLELVPEPEAVAPVEVEARQEEAEEDAEVHPFDPEMAEIFAAEAGELLEQIEAGLQTWESSPDDAGPLRELQRALHTLKGGARMGGLTAMGTAAHDMESMLNVFEHGASPSAQDFTTLRYELEMLHRMHDALRRGEGARLAQAGVEEFAPPPRAPEPEPESVAAPTIAPPPAAPPPVMEPYVEQAPAEDEEDTEIHAFDPEMAEIFSGEAAELLEQIDTGLNHWQADTGNAEALRDLQRALHTLKGGARMGGLTAMGSAAHDMETQLNAIESGQYPADAQAFSRLRMELEMLQRMHDALRRGEGVRLAEGAAEDFAPSAPSPVVPVTRAPAESQAPAQRAAAGAWDPRLFWKPEDERAGLGILRRETARVPVENLEAMLNQAGEISIYRSRLEQQSTAVTRSLTEMDQTIARVRDQLRAMNIETEAQIAARGLGGATTPDRYGGAFDPLEMDRYSRMQELSRAIAESVGDLHSLHETMTDLMSESETLLLQQSRINTEVQQGLMSTLMVPFSRQVQRFQRLVRQVAEESGKKAEVSFVGVEAELDRNVLERMTGPLEHLLRNAVVHGIESPAVRRERGKPEIGEIRVTLTREGTRLLMELADDGGGLDFNRIRKVATERGLLTSDMDPTEDELAMFIFRPGFSTAKELTQVAGRGVGMDVVASEVKQLGGTLDLRSEIGKGMRLVIRLPLTLAISQALLVSVGHETYAIPLASIEGIARIPEVRLRDHYSEDGPPFLYGNQSYRVRYLGDFLGLPRHDVTERTVPAILVRVAEGLGAQERRVAVVVDVLHGNREVVSKSAGPQVSTVIGLSGATILPDGRVVLILDVQALVQERVMARRTPIHAAPVAEVRDLILVVDDSITIRRVTERLLTKHGFRVATAKDGLDAMAWLQTDVPSAILLDIEMPRADGFEVATFVRNTDRTREVPIIMITSRSGEKHRERARSLGVDRYVIKPYQEEQLMTELRSVLEPQDKPVRT